jgi:crotonobetaine/carnitine-CoA ligase
LSLTHDNAQNLTLSLSLHSGRPSVFSVRFTKTRLWETIRKYGCARFNLLGGMTMAIYSEPVKPDDADNPVRQVLSAGMPAAIWRNLDGSPLVVTYINKSQA